MKLHQFQSPVIFHIELTWLFVVFPLFKVCMYFRSKKWKKECMCWQRCYPPCTNLWHQMLLRIKHSLKGRHQSVDWVSNLAAHSLVSPPALTSVPIHTVTCTTWTTVALWWVPCRFPMCWSVLKEYNKLFRFGLMNFQLWMNIYLFKSEVLH
jgi:hypothetical protein